jgi:hypothetical protein
MPHVDALMQFRAPYLIDKLRRERLVATPEEGEQLFQELKKFLYLDALRPNSFIPMFSRRVDEVWHQFVLFTAEYAQFCDHFFGRYFHHAPSIIGESGEEARPTLGSGGFAALYAEHFGELPEIWSDARSLTRDTRMFVVRYAKPMTVRVAGAFAELVVLREPELVALRVSARAAAALRFVLETDAFYVRELPGLGPAEQVALGRTLVDIDILRVAP